MEADGDLRRQLLRAVEQADQFANDLRNYRRNTERQLAQARQTAHEDLLAELGEILQGLERAVEAADADRPDPGAVRTGVALVLRGIEAIYERHGVRRIPTQGVPFDPELHEAVLVEPQQDVPAGTVVRELSPGFRNAARVIRPAKVSVSG